MCGREGGGGRGEGREIKVWELNGRCYIEWG